MTKCLYNAGAFITRSNDVAYSTAAIKHKSEFDLTKYTLYLALTGELWGVYCEELGEFWPRYNGIAL